MVSRPELIEFQGEWTTHYFRDNWENIQNFKARQDDVLIVTYPKSGSTWVSYMLDLLYYGQSTPQSPRTGRLHERVTVFEMCFPGPQPESGGPPPVYTGTEQLDNLVTSPRLIRTHLPVRFLPKSFWDQNCRIIYVARNARDSVVSYFHFDRMSLVQPEPGDWNSYLHRFMEGKMVHGSWYDHVSSWWEKKATYSNLHFMFYEDLVEDTGREIDKLCSFLGLSPSVEEMEGLKGTVEFDSMKQDMVVNQVGFPWMDTKISSFMRKGKVGDWKNHFTVAQNEEFEEDYKKKMKNPTLKFCNEPVSGCK
ncbi:cytosolic sulfotransferase 1-like [Platichthys flesus]|uniref:cytosolic sulfotransferase 1-like n=1 Tax=Platichthys flesus TaxID=8260 RepID=UPI002DBCEE4B|nr:cytosolic sulfotransferase 1-like [Platichthys flesus]